MHVRAGVHGLLCSKLTETSLMEPVPLSDAQPGAYWSHGRQLVFGTAGKSQHVIGVPSVFVHQERVQTFFSKESFETNRTGEQFKD